MVKSTNLLPPGFYDIITTSRPRRIMVEKMISYMEENGYIYIDPPMVEFEDSVVYEGQDAPVFKLMDPQARRGIALRPDITLQAARIAATRYKNAPRPLRLCYHGNVIKTHEETYGAGRQVTQIGAEIIGKNGGQQGSMHDVQAISLALELLKIAGLEKVTIDFTLPGFIDMLLADIPANDAVKLKEAAQLRNISALSEMEKDAGAEVAQLLLGVISKTGYAATQHLSQQGLDGRLSRWIAEMEEVARKVESATVDISFSPLENTGFHFERGLSFSIITAKNGMPVREIGRGGRYEISANGEQATGFSLSINAIMEAMR